MAKKKNTKTSRKKKPLRVGRSVFLGRIAKGMGGLVAVLILLYFSLGFALDKGFIKRDLNEKMGKVLGVTTITLRIVGDPIKPVVTATPVCINYVPYVNLTWSSHEMTDYYNVERDGDPLVAGLTEPEYQDVLVDPLTSYSYTVTGVNIYGETTSDPAAAVTLDCGTPPPPPFLTATSACVDDAPVVHLSWTTEDEFNYFDITRNSSSLIGGITGTEYNDESVEESSNYSYSLTAFTDEGYVVPNSADVSTTDCEEPLPPPGPTCIITKFEKTNLAGFDGTLKTDERRPSIYGTTNIPNATIEIVISGETSIVATTSASSNGYWMWRPTEKLNYGSHTITVTATDPNDPTQTKTTTLNFKIEEEDEEEEEEQEESMEGVIPTVPPEVIPPVSPEVSLPEISVKVLNPDKIAYPGRDLSLETKIAPGENEEPFDTDIEYKIVDENYEEVMRAASRIHIDGEMTLEKNLSIPRLLKPGKYKILVSIWRNGTLIVAEESFVLKEVPIAHLGTGVAITATQIMANLFWVIMWLLILLIIFLVFLEIEYWISRRAIIQITEEKLRERGFITRKKIQ